MAEGEVEVYGLDDTDNIFENRERENESHDFDEVNMCFCDLFL